MKRWVIPALVAWAGLAAVIAWLGFGDVSDDGKAFAGAMSIVGPLSALAGARLLWLDSPIVGALLLIVAAATPTYGAAAINLFPFAVALYVLIWQRTQLRRGG